MRTMRTPMILTAATVLAACAPLSQAGLVYASRGQAGVTVATGTPETPGLELNIGMKVNDFAYIPVVVGRPCEFTSRTQCDQALIQVRGHNDIGDMQSSEGNDRPGPVQRSGSPTTKSADQAPPAGSSPAAQAAEAAQVAVQAAESAQAAADAAKFTRQASNVRNDALSVYGTFDSNGNAAGSAQANAGLRLGRVFSTGLASQNLTEGERDARRAEALAQCIQAARLATANLPAGEATNTLLQQLLGGCAPARISN